MTDGRGEEILAGGPIHKLIVEFELNRFRGELLPELERLKELDIVRVIDLIAVRKDRLGGFAVLSTSDLTPEEAVEFGAAVGAEALEDGHLFDPRDATARGRDAERDDLRDRAPRAPLGDPAAEEDRPGRRLDRDGGLGGVSDLISIGLGAGQTPLGLAKDVERDSEARSETA